VDAFSDLFVLISIVIGLAITQLLSGYRAVLIARAHVRFFAPTTRSPRALLRAGALVLRFLVGAAARQRVQGSLSHRPLADGREPVIPWAVLRDLGRRRVDPKRDLPPATAGLDVVGFSAYIFVLFAHL
jgi:hypothetical protein